MKTFFYCALAAGLLLFLPACASGPALPPQEEPPQAPSFPPPSLAFDGIQAEDPDNLTLRFALEIENPFPYGGTAAIESWRVEVNGLQAHAGFSLEGAESGFPVGAGASASFPLRLDMDVAALAAEGLAPADDYEVILIAELSFSGLPEGVQVSGHAAFPGVRPPVFSITDIAILKAELINTRFRVGMMIGNPNPFPLVLSSFGYELYGNGRLWADGVERNDIRIPAKTTVEGSLFLLMNFMGMRRALLDQIINLAEVSYRFAGEAQVSTGIDHLPTFTTRFELSGFSRVLED